MALLAFLASLFGGGCKREPDGAARPPTGADAAKETRTLPKSDSPPSPNADVMKELRTMMLTTPASKVGIQPSERYPMVFGVVMDIPVSHGHTASVVSLGDGTASLYTTSTFGVLGGIGHESVRSAAMSFVAAAQSHYDGAVPTTEYPYPLAGHIRFYLLGFNGVRVIDAESASVEGRGGRYSALWAAGQGLLTELRLVTQKKQDDRAAS